MCVGGGMWKRGHEHALQRLCDRVSLWLERAARRFPLHALRLSMI